VWDPAGVHEEKNAGTLSGTRGKGGGRSPLLAPLVKKSECHVSPEGKKECLLEHCDQHQKGQQQKKPDGAAPRQRCIRGKERVSPPLRKKEKERLLLKVGTHRRPARRKPIAGGARNARKEEIVV